MAYAAVGYAMRAYTVSSLPRLHMSLWTVWTVGRRDVCFTHYAFAKEKVGAQKWNDHCICVYNERLIDFKKHGVTTTCYSVGEGVHMCRQSKEESSNPVFRR